MAGRSYLSLMCMSMLALLTLLTAINVLWMLSYLGPRDGNLVVFVEDLLSNAVSKRWRAQRSVSAYDEESEEAGDEEDAALDVESAVKHERQGERREGRASREASRERPMSGAQATWQVARGRGKRRSPTRAPGENVSQRARSRAPIASAGGVRRLTFYVPPNHHYDCRSEKLLATGFVGAKPCGTLLPFPTSDNSKVKYCGPPFNTYATHYFYFVHAVFLQNQLEEITGVHMEATADPFSADIVLCRADGAAEFRHEAQKMNQGKQPLLIIIEDHDAATMVAPRELIGDAATIAVLKHYAWKGYGGMCPHWEKPMYRHIELMRLFELRHVPGGTLSVDSANSIVEKEGCERWPMEVQTKFMMALPQWVTVRRGCVFPPFKKLTPIRRRPVDIAFAGTLNYSDFGESEPWQQAVSRYRHRFLDNLHAACEGRGWRTAIHTTPIKKLKFFELLQRTKIFISPWGLGEWSGKDEESILAGAVLLKPGASFFRSAIPMYTPGVTCLEVRPDGVDLKHVLANALAQNNLEELERIQLKAHQVQAQYVSYGKAVRHGDVLRDFAELVKRAADTVR